MSGKGKTFRRECRLQNFTAVCYEFEGQDIAGQYQLSYWIWKLVGRDSAVDDRPVNGNLDQRQKAGQARAAQRAAVGRVQPDNTVVFKYAVTSSTACSTEVKSPRYSGWCPSNTT